MELTDFLTEGFIKTFSGTLISVELIVFVTKGLPLIKKIPTRVYAFLLALAHLIIVKSTSGTISYDIQSFYLIFLNSIVITVILCGGYDAMMNRIKLINSIVSEDKNDEKNINTIVNEDDKESKITDNDSE